MITKRKIETDELKRRGGCVRNGHLRRLLSRKCGFVHSNVTCPISGHLGKLCNEVHHGLEHNKCSYSHAYNCNICSPLSTPRKDPSIASPNHEIKIAIKTSLFKEPIIVLYNPPARPLHPHAQRNRINTTQLVKDEISITIESENIQTIVPIVSSPVEKVFAKNQLSNSGKKFGVLCGTIEETIEYVLCQLEKAPSIPKRIDFNESGSNTRGLLQTLIIVIPKAVKIPNTVVSAVISQLAIRKLGFETMTDFTNTFVGAKAQIIKEIGRVTPTNLPRSAIAIVEFSKPITIP